MDTASISNNVEICISISIERTTPHCLPIVHTLRAMKINCFCKLRKRNPSFTLTVPQAETANFRHLC